MMVIRQEKPEDFPAIRQVNEQAFARAAEADLVEILRQLYGMLPGKFLVFN